MSVSVGTRHMLDYSWLHDDLEEELGGADWHQDAIRALSTSLQTLANERGWAWHVGDQLTVVGAKPDATEWRPVPDISIHPRLGLGKRQDIDVRVDGPPSLVIEVASPTTWTYDVSVESIRSGKRQAGKAYGYLNLMRVPEYLVFDPHREFLAGQVRAWRRVGDAVEEWRPNADGRYDSQTLDISFRPDGPLLRVFDPDGNPVPYWFEARRENVALQQRIADLVQRHSDRVRKSDDAISTMIAGRQMTLRTRANSLPLLCGTVLRGGIGAVGAAGHRDMTAVQQR